jgi:low affinity Fe/Cu permease
MGVGPHGIERRENMSRNKGSHRRINVLEQFSSAVTRWTGRTPALILACTVIVVWGLTGPIFGFSDTWQLVINTGTTIVTFLMVFLIQRSQNKEAMAIQLKLNEIVAALKGASNRLIGVEDLSEEELVALHRHYARLVAMSKKETDLTKSHSVEEAEARHRFKHGR